VSAVVTCSGLLKSFGPVRAVDHIDLDVRGGEMLALLGPSGCGKTTMLRLIAGLERPDEGEVRLNGVEVAGPRCFVPSERRRIGLVFQDYALFPHLSVARNVGYGVRDRRRRRERVAEMLDLVGLADVGDRLPHELSGGQQQRVALGRALAPDPAIVLLDEPFSNLDAALRARVRGEVRSILAAASATSVFVTHDQEEALAISDRIAVMRAGRVLQLDEPAALYSGPSDRFVASFVGDADLLPGRAAAGTVSTDLGALSAIDGAPDGDVEVVLRPEHVRLRLDGSGAGVVREITYFGHDQLIEVALASGRRVHSRMGPGRVFHPGDRVSVAVVGPVMAFPVPA
jgi:iron(III) transport system ATP-binding protein